MRSLVFVTVGTIRILWCCDSFEGYENLYCKSLSQALDRNSKGKITFQDLVAALSTMARGSNEEKIQCKSVPFDFFQFPLNTYFPRPFAFHYFFNLLFQSHFECTTSTTQAIYRKRTCWTWSPLSSPSDLKLLCLVDNIGYLINYHFSFEYFHCPGKRYESPQELVDDFFVLFDIDKDDRISFAEYKQVRFDGLSSFFTATDKFLSLYLFRELIHTPPSCRDCNYGTALEQFGGR